MFELVHLQDTVHIPPSEFGTPLLKAMQLVCAQRPGVLSNSKLSEQLVQVAAERGVLQ